MKLSEEGSLRVLALLLLTAGLVAGSIIPGLTPSLTDQVQGQEEGEAPPETQSFHSPQQAASLQGMSPTPQDALARVAAERDAPAPPPLPEVEGEDPLPDAIRTLARSGTSDDVSLDDPEVQARLDRAARLPQGLQEDLALVVLAVAQARDLQAEAVADLTPDERRALSSGDMTPTQAREIRSKVDVGKSLQAARLMDAALQEARPGLDAWSDVAKTGPVQARGLADPAEAPSAAEQGASVVDALGTPRNPQDMIRTAAALQGHGDVETPPMPEVLQEASLDELLVTTYTVMGVPKTPRLAASVAAVDGLPEPVRETTAQGLRHYLHALMLQQEALADLTPTERRALQKAGPGIVGMDGAADASAPGLSSVEAAAVFQAAKKIDMRRVHQSAAVLAQASDALAKDQGPIPSTPVGDCPKNDRNPEVDGVSPVATDEPVECTVGDLTVRLGLTDDSAVVLQVHTDGGEGGPEYGTEEPLGRSSSIRLHWDPAKAQVTVYQDTNEDNSVQRDEIEFQTEPLRDQSNNVAFTDPLGYVVVGAQGPTVFDGRYGKVQVPPDARDQRLKELRGTAENNLPSVVRQFIDNDGSGIYPRVIGADCQETKPGEGQCGFDSRRVDDTAWRQLHRPVNYTVNPNGTHMLTVDLGGDSVYNRNIGSAIFDFLGPWDPDENVTVARLGTGQPADEGLPSLVSHPQTLFVGAPGLAVDLGGDDRYATTLNRNFGTGGINRNLTVGAGALGVPGVVVDRVGDDVYRAENQSVGAGFLSVGLAADLGGDDEVHAENSSIGMSNFGSGLVLNQGGNDSYRGAAFSQGVGLASNAVGLFADTGEGNDTYTAAMENGFRFVISFTFQEYKKVAQGAAIGLGTGLMLDGGGDDLYRKPRISEENPPEPRIIQGVSFKDLPRFSDDGQNDPLDFVDAGIAITESFFPGMPGILADLGGDDEGLNRTSTIEHSYLGEVGLGPHFPNSSAGSSDASAPAGYVIDAHLPEGEDAEAIRGNGYAFRPGEVTWEAEKDPVSSSNFTLTVPGLLAVGTVAPTEWSESYVVSIDLGGPDTYRNRPGSADILPGAVPGTFITGGGSAVGDDQYRPRLASLHVDLGGSDRYTAEAVRDRPSQQALGSGVGAVGLAYDLTAENPADGAASAAAEAEVGGGPEDDVYEAGTRALGHGFLGVGVFHDESGDDRYRFVNASNPSRGLGFGSLGGVGVFADGAGNDVYRAEGLSLGAYDAQVTRSPELVRRDVNGTADNNDAETGAGVFLEASGGDTYNVSLEAMGYVRSDDDLLQDVAGTVDDARALPALFVDDGFGIDSYPEVHREAGHDNNDFWNSTALGRGFDNLDYYMHYQYVQAGDETGRRAISLLLSPSARIVDPAYPANGSAARETLTGTNVVTVNATYGGNRSLLLNARSLAVAPFRTDTPEAAGLAEAIPEPCRTTRDNTPYDDIFNECPPPPPEVGGFNRTDVAEMGHWGVRYANATYDALKFMLSSEDDRGGEDGEAGTPDTWEDETQRGIDIVEEDTPAEAPVQFNGSTTQSILDLFVWGVAYGVLDDTACTLESNEDDQTCASDLTGDLVVDFLLEGLTERLLAGFLESAGFPRDTVWRCSDAAVTFAVGGQGSYGPCPFPLPENPSASPATKVWTAKQTLALDLALADTVSAGDALDPAVNTALRNLGVPDATAKDAHGSLPVNRTDPGAGDGGGSGGTGPEADHADATTAPQQCAPLVDFGATPSAGDPDDPVDAYLSCVIRASFHDAIETADEVRNQTADACPDTGVGSCGALPEVINTPQGGEFVRAVELSADGKEIATVEGSANGFDNTYEIHWDVTELDEDGRYRWEDGNHTLSARAFYRPAEPRADGGGATGNRTRDPYGFYPGVDRIQVRTDAPPRVYSAEATDFDPDGPELDGVSCGWGPADLQCQLNYTAEVSEDAKVSAEVVPLDLGPDGDDSARSVSASIQQGTPFNVTTTWDPSGPADGLWALNLTLEDPELGVTVTDATPFYVTSDAPSTLATPVANDAGFSGLQHVSIDRKPNGEPDDTVETPYTLNVTAKLDTNGDGTPDRVQPRSPIVDVTLYRRVYDPATNEEADEIETGECPGTFDTFEGTGGAKWCKDPVTDVAGNTSIMDITTTVQTEQGPDKVALDQRQYYLVAQARDAAGHVENVTFPEVGPDIQVDDDPEGQTYLDLDPPTSSVTASAEPRNHTTLRVPYEVNGAPQRSVTVYWDLAPNASAAGSDLQELPKRFVGDGGPGAFVWSPDVGETPEDGDHLYLTTEARDAAGNVEEAALDSRFVVVRFDFSGPEVLGNVSTERRAGSLAVNWSTSDALSNSSARIWPAGHPGDARLVNASGEPTQHRAVFEGLDQNTPYTVELVMRDVAGNWNNVTVGNVTTDTVIDIDPLAPGDGDVLSGEAAVSWVATRVTGDPFVEYNLTLAPEAGPCSIPLETTSIFEGEPVRREVAIDTEELPSVEAAQICLRANNTRNPDDPVLQRIPANGTFSIDNEAPTTNLTARGPGTGEWIRERAQVVLEANDSTPDNITTRYTVEDGPIRVHDGPFVLEEDGVYTVEFWSEDRLGHVEKHRTAEVRVDGTPPEGTLAIDGGESRTRDRTVNLEINGTDAASGVADIVVVSPGGHHRRLPGALLQGGEIEVPWKVSPDDGRKRVRVVLVDEAGNQLTLRRTTTLDTRAPTFERLESRGVGFTQAAVDWATDEPSGGEVLYKEEGSPAFEGRIDVNETGVQHSVVLENLTPATTYVVKVVAEDPLGNAGARAISFTTERDKTPPGPVEALQTDVLPSGFVELNWSASFDEVGVASYVVARSTDDGFVKVAETPRTVLLDDEAPPGQTLRYKVQAVDVGGNAGPPSEPVTVTTDTAPEILDPKVTPEQGTPDDTFTYSITVRDRDGDSPEVVEAIVDGERRSMTPTGTGDITQGVTYTLQTGLEATTLSQGTHTYGFHVNDGSQETSWPDEGVESGPVVVDRGDGTEVAGFGAVRRAVPSAGPAMILAAFAAAAVVSARRWTP